MIAMNAITTANIQNILFFIRQILETLQPSAGGGGYGMTKTLSGEFPFGRLGPHSIPNSGR